VPGARGAPLLDRRESSPSRSIRHADKRISQCGR
jgi:hypothetical protein